MKADIKVTDIKHSWKDRDEIVLLEDRTFRDDGWIASDLLSLQDHKYTFVTYKAGGVFVGYVVYKICTNFISIPSLVIQEECRGMSAGTQLLYEVCKISKTMNMDIVAIARNGPSDGIDFYRRNSFKLIDFDENEIVFANAKPISGALLKYQVHKYHWTNRIKHYLSVPKTNA